MARGGAVSTSSPARVVIENGAVAEVETRGERIPAERVISAVPWFALPDLFAGDTAPLAALLRAASSTGASPIVTVNVWLDRRVFRGLFWGCPGGPSSGCSTKGRCSTPERSHLAFVSSGAEPIVRLPSDELTARALEELREAMPESRRAGVLRTSVVRERRATFSLAPGQPPRPTCRPRWRGCSSPGTGSTPDCPLRSRARP